MLKPRIQELAVVPAQGTIGTSVAGIFAETIVISSFDELKSKMREVN